MTELNNLVPWDTSVLRKVGINEQEKNTSIQELGNENHVSNGCELLTVSVFTDPLNAFNCNHLKNCVHSNDEECNTLTHDL